jgi:hypothetical protein
VYILSCVVHELVLSNPVNALETKICKSKFRSDTRVNNRYEFTGSRETVHSNQTWSYCTEPCRFSEMQNREFIPISFRVGLLRRLRLRTITNSSDRPSDFKSVW